jgi:hypothetical protein
MDLADLRRRAKHFREMAREATDQNARAAALDLASEYEEEADAIVRFRRATPSPEQSLLPA